ncbi:hypothetical protein LY76DRAFT_142201 [Colletotrichum caudatum]|nr:hypothetical protein LY76DRAFT_142201 [Colletotrichum caudatum]
MDTRAFLFSLFGDRLGCILAHHPPPPKTNHDCSLPPCQRLGRSVLPLLDTTKHPRGVPLTNQANTFCRVLHRLSTLAPRQSYTNTITISFYTYTNCTALSHPISHPLPHTHNPLRSKHHTLQTQTTSRFPTPLFFSFLFFSPSQTLPPIFFLSDTFHITAFIPTGVTGTDGSDNRTGRIGNRSRGPADGLGPGYGGPERTQGAIVQDTGGLGGWGAGGTRTDLIGNRIHGNTTRSWWAAHSIIPFVLLFLFWNWLRGIFQLGFRYVTYGIVS